MLLPPRPPSLTSQSPLPPPLLPCLVYLVLSPALDLVRSWVGAQSEYRFPHPLFATCFHLALALGYLLVLAVAARVALRLRLSLPPQIKNAARAFSAPFPPFSLSYSPSLRPLLLPTALSFFSSLLFTDLSRHADPSFLVFVRLLPVFFSLFLPSAQGAQARVRAVGVGLVLLGGKGVGMAAGGREWVEAVGWAWGVVGWVEGVRKAAGRSVQGGRENGQEAQKKGQEEQQDSESLPLILPILTTHLLLSLALLLLPLLFLPNLSPELSLISKSHHWSFFSSPGFWAQEAGMALCELVHLVVFLWAALTLPPPTVFSLSATSYLYIRPLIANWAFGNPLDLLELGGEGVLGRKAQGGWLMSVGGWAVYGGEEVERKGVKGKEG